jgi:hypothetical protein
VVQTTKKINLDVLRKEYLGSQMSPTFRMVSMIMSNNETTSDRAFDMLQHICSESLCLHVTG